MSIAKLKKTFPEQRETLGALLRVSYRELAHRLYAELANLGFPDIRPAHSAVLRNLVLGGSRITDLAERAEMTKQSMAYLVSDLERLGYIQLEKDTEDRRAKRVIPTTRGKQLLDTLVETSTQIESDLQSRIGASAVADLRALLRQVAIALGTHT